MVTTLTPPTALDIATRAQQHKVLYLALNLTSTTMLLPELPVLTTLLTRMEADPNSDFPLELFHGNTGDADEKPLTFSAREVLTVATRIRGEAIRDLMSTSMINAGVIIGDMIQKGGHGSTTVPLLQFARHFRNACGHGDRWDFRDGAPPHPAACRHVTLTAAHNGQRATWETVTPRLFVEFLDDIANYFVPGIQPPPTLGT